MITESTTGENYVRNSQMSRVGGLVEIPHHSIGVTTAPVEPFGDTVQVSWLQPPDYDWGRGVNKLRVNAEQRPLDDDDEITIPAHAFSPCVFEPPGEDEATVYYLG